MQNESEIRGIRKDKGNKIWFVSWCFDRYLKTQHRGTGIDNVSRNDLDRLKNCLCQFSTAFWHCTCTCMEHLDFPGSQLHEKYNVWFYVKWWTKKKRSLKQLEFTDCCTLECPGQTCCTLQFCYCIQVLRRWFWVWCYVYVIGVISQLSSRAEASGADTMGCCVRRWSRWSDPEWSGCWHCATLVRRHRASRAAASVCLWVGSWGSELWTVSQIPASDFCHHSLCM